MTLLLVSAIALIGFIVGVHYGATQTESRFVDLVNELFSDDDDQGDDW